MCRQYCHSVCQRQERLGLCEVKTLYLIHLMSIVLLQKACATLHACTYHRREEEQEKETESLCHLCSGIVCEEQFCDSNPPHRPSWLLGLLTGRVMTGECFAVHVNRTA